MAQPWETHFRTPAPCDHVIQLHTDDGFLTRGVVEFIGTGLEHGEGAVVVATSAHMDAILTALSTRIDVAATRARTQLVVLDAQGCLDRFMRDGRPDPGRFFPVIIGLLDRVVAAGFPMIRVFGEMVDLLWSANLPATLELEELWNQVLAARGVSLLCAYRIDPFDGPAHRGVLHELSRSHTHLVPVEDYARFERAVEQACQEAGLPRELRGQLSDLADDVLARAREHYVRG